MLKILKLIPVQSRLIFSLVIGVHALILFGTIYGQAIASRNSSDETLSVAIVRNVSRHDSLDANRNLGLIKTSLSPVHQDAILPNSVGRSSTDLPPLRSALNLNERNIYPNPKPPYPLSSRRLREQGVVKLSLCVNPLGTVESVSMVSSSGHEKLDKSAIETVRTWRFASQAIDHQTPSHCYLLPIRFSLEA